MLTDHAPTTPHASMRPIETFNSGLIQIEQLPSPVDLGLPDKFKEFRPGQLRGYSLMNQAQTPYQLISMGTGTGKSLTYTTYAYMSGKRTVILTSTKGLQDQAIDDFSEIGMVDIRGRNNYQCRLHSSIKCDVGSASKCPYDNGPHCPYSSALNRAQASNLVVTNYKYFMLMQKHAREDRGLGKFDLMICDEGHAVEDEVCGAASLELTRHQIVNMLGAEWPSRLTVPGMQAFAQQFLPVAEARCDQMERLMTGADNSTRPELARRVLDWKTLEETLHSLAKNMIGQWVLNSSDRSIRLEPLWAAGHAQALLLKNVKQAVLVSATLFPKSAQLLDMRLDEYEYMEIPSPFDPRRNPFLHIPTVKVGRDMSGVMIERWLERINEILLSRVNKRGIIHTVSYNRASVITQSLVGHNFLTNENALQTQGMVQMFKERARNPNDNTVVVTPSLTTGYDFPLNECEFQIIAKVPFLDRSDPVLNLRCSMDPTYGTYRTTQDLLQMAGRGMRREDDRCETFVIDDNISWFLFRDAKPFLSRTFLQSYAKRNSLPANPPKVTSRR